MSFRFDDLQGRTLLLTGITRGIGRALLPGLLGQGLRLIALSRGMDRMEAIRSDLGVGEDRLLLLECDFSDPASVDAAAQAVLDTGLPLDALLHNAAIDPRHGFEEEEDAFWQRVLQVNLLAPVALTRRLLPLLRQSDQGRVLFTGSVMFDLGGAQLTAYASTKGALVGVTRSLSHELGGAGITVNCIIPGAIKVEKEPAGLDEILTSFQSVPRRLLPEDLLAPMCLLLSKWGSGISGQTLTIDGDITHPLATPKQQGQVREAL